MPYSLHIDPGQTLEIFGTVHIAFGPAEYTIYNDGTIDIHEDGWLHITPGRSIQNNGTINNSGLFDNYGTIRNYGTIDNTGELWNLWSSTFNTTFENKGFVFNQHGHILNTGTISNTRCPGEVGVITAGPTNLENYGTIEYVNGPEC